MVASARAKGYGLVEILGVLLLVAVLLLLARSRMTSRTPVQRLDGATKALAATLEKTRERAVAERACLRVVFFRAAAAIQTQRLESGTCSASGGFADEGSPSPIDKTGVIRVSSSANPVFEPRGTVEGSTVATIRLSTARGDAVRAILVRNTGRIDVKE